MFSLQARYVFPVDLPPIPDGVVTIDDGRIVAVGRRANGATPRDLGNVAILPGLVNAHTHLEFSDLQQPIGASGARFTDWIQSVVAHRRAAQAQDGFESQRRQAFALGLQASLSHGTTALGEIATWPVPYDVFRSAALDATVFLEFIGLATERLEPVLATAREHLAVAEAASGTWRPGLSPHAPYTVHPELLARLCRLSCETHVPIAMHLAESLEELELLQSGSGPFVELLRSLDAWSPAAIPRGIRPLNYLETLATAHRVLVVHGTFLSTEEIGFLASRSDRTSVVYCPRTHVHFGRGDYPLAEMLAAGVNVALGTDSRASNPDLSVLAELRHCYFQHPEIAAEVILRLGTRNGAKALGQDQETGTLAPGRHADLAIVALPDAEAHDPHELLFEGGQSVVMTYRQGACCWATT